MKIIMITPFWHHTKGGVATVAYNLSSELKGYGCSVQVLTPDDDPGIIKLPKNKFLMVWKVIQVLRSIKPDVVHVHSYGSLLLPAVLYKILLNPRVKLIFTFHTQPHTQAFLDEHLTKDTNNRGHIKKIVLNFLLSHCDTTTCVSKSLMEALQRSGIKLIYPTIIPNGVKIKPIDSQDVENFRKYYNLINNYPILCMVGVFSWDWKVKGIMILIQALNKILYNYSKAKLILVGDGQYRKTLERYVEKEGLDESVVFTGMMDNPFIAISVCDIYCHISLNEAFGLAPLEAMAIGKPVIASNDGGLPEIISNELNGILVNSNPDSVARAIISLLEKPNTMQDLSHNAACVARTKFSWSNIAQEYIKLYERKV